MKQSNLIELTDEELILELQKNNTAEAFDIADDRYRPDTETDSEIKDEIIQKALLKVSDTYREAVILRGIQGLS